MTKLRLEHASDAGTKPSKALVILGKAAGIMKSLPKLRYETMTIPEENTGDKIVFSNRKANNVVEYFIRLCRGAVQ